MTVCLGFFGTDAILVHAKVWVLVLWKCPRCSMTLWSASTFYTSAKRLTHLKLLKCALTYSHTWAGYFTVIFAGSFHYFKPVSCWILFCENVAGVPRPTSIMPGKGEHILKSWNGPLFWLRRLRRMSHKLLLLDLFLILCFLPKLTVKWDESSSRLFWPATGPYWQDCIWSVNSTIL